MKIGIIAAISLCLLALPVFAETVVVTGDNVNLRAAPVANAEVVFQVMDGNKLEVAGKEEGWVKVVPPAKASLWVYGEMVRNNLVAVSKLRVRSGQGTNYKTVGYLKRGAKLEVRGKEGDWLKIAPPEGSYLWISADYVKQIKDKPKPPPEKKAPVKKTPPPEKKPPAPEKNPVTVKKPVKKPPMPQGSLPPVKPTVQSTTIKPAPSSTTKRHVLKNEEISEDMAKVLTMIRPSEGKGRVVQYKGTLRKSSLVWRRPSKYRLIMNDERGRAFTICYVLGAEKRLKEYVGRVLLVYGREYWVEGVRYSVVIPEQIVTRD